MDANKTIKEGKEFLRAGWEKGVECPCCGQLVKLYKRKLNIGMAVFLISLYKLDQERHDWFHAREILALTKSYTTSRDYCILEYFGLAEPREKDPEDTDRRTSGYWRLTDKGREFVLNHINVLSHVLIFNNRYFRAVGKDINIIQALGNKFNYQELMNA